MLVYLEKGRRKQSNNLSAMFSIGDVFDGQGTKRFRQKSNYETTRKLTWIEKWIYRDFRAIVENFASHFGGFVCHCEGLEILFDYCWRIDWLLSNRCW